MAISGRSSHPVSAILTPSRTGMASLLPLAGARVLTSADGISWTPREAGGEESLHVLGYGNGLFVAQGSSDTILTSADGVDLGSASGREKNTSPHEHHLR